MEPGLNSSQTFVWMPTLKVWMPSPSQSLSTSAQPKSCSTRQSKRKFSSDDHNTDSPSKPPNTPQDPASSCPICLGNDIHQTQLVVLRLCMHQFCAKCIHTWSALQRKCPLCKREFDGWFYDIQGPENYREKRLLPLAEAPEPSVNGNGQRETDTQRSLQYARGRILDNQRRTRPLPRRRFFAHSRFVPAAEKRRLEEAGAAEKALRWRASIYRKGLRAIPPRLQNRTNIKQNITGELNEKARIERRLEPWIRRELEAILGDQDPTVLVHLVFSLWLSRLRKQEGKQNLVPSSNEDEFMQQLEPFIGDKANAFWHELRCFAESPFTMSAYDSIAEYQRPLSKSADPR